MANTIHSSLGNVFSIIPQSKAKHALDGIVEAYLEQDGVFSSNIKWAEFHFDGAFIRGGISTFDQVHTELLTAASNDPDIMHMIELTADGNVRAGDSFYDSCNDAMYWFVPVGRFGSDSGADTHGGLKGLCIRAPLFSEILDMFNAPTVLTTAEKRVVFQLTAGLSLRDAAMVQGVSIETKRAQLKSACAKLQCGGQSDLIRLSLGQVSHLVTATSTEALQSDELEQFVSQYLAGIATVNVVTLENGRSLRYLVMGPESGKPVLMVHGMLFPLMLLCASELLNEYEIRLYVPIRNGYLQPQIMAELMKESVSANDYVDDIAHFATRMFDAPVPILAQSFGCQFAIRLCRDYSGLVSRIFMLSMNYADSTSQTSSYNRRFFDGLRELHLHPGLFRYVTWQFRKYYVNNRQASKTLTKMFSESDSDRRVLSQAYCDRPSCAWFSSLFKQSVVGIADDMSFAMNTWQNSLEGLKQPIVWLHGSRDTFSDVNAVREVALKGGHDFEEIDDGGHLIYASHATQVWACVAKFLGVKD